MASSSKKFDQRRAKDKSPWTNYHAIETTSTEISPKRPKRVRLTGRKKKTRNVISVTAEQLHEFRRSRPTDKASEVPASDRQCGVVTEQPKSFEALPLADSKCQTQPHGTQLGISKFACCSSGSTRTSSVQPSDSESYYHDRAFVENQIMVIGSSHERIGQKIPGPEEDLPNYSMQYTASYNPTRGVTANVNWLRRKGLQKVLPRVTKVDRAPNNEQCHIFNTSSPQCTDPGLCGLVNLGNTCFMNSTLQCLSHTTLLKEYFIGNYYQDLNRDNPFGTGGMLADSFSILLKDLWDGNRFSDVRPEAFKEIFGIFAPIFSGYSQQDSQEFLTFLLDGLHEDVNKACGKTEELEAILRAANDNEDQKLANEAWVEYLEENDSKIVGLFQLQLRSRLTCGNKECQYVTRNFDSYRCLLLTIPDEYVGTSSEQDYSCTIYDCLNMFTKSTGSGEKNWACEGCNTLVEVQSKTDLWRTPEILVVYFKRFRTTWQGRYKLETSIKFPIQGLDLSPYVTNRESGCYYDLYATINHAGSVHGGHYTSFVKHGERWYKFNDTRIKSVLNPEVVCDPRLSACTAYVLFYEKTSRPPYNRPEHIISRCDPAHVQRHQPDTSFQCTQRETAFTGKATRPAYKASSGNLPPLKFHSSDGTMPDSESQQLVLMIRNTKAEQETMKIPESIPSTSTFDHENDGQAIKQGEDPRTGTECEQNFAGRVLCYERKSEKAKHMIRVQLGHDLLPNRCQVKSSTTGLQSGCSQKQAHTSEKSYQVAPSGLTCSVSSLQSSAASNTVDRQTNKIESHDQLDHGLEETLVDNPAKLGLRALPDFGGMSFMNAVLQCLYHSSVLRKHFTDTHTTDCKSKLSKSFAEVFCEMNKSGHMHAQLSTFQTNAGNVRGYVLKDAQLFLKSLLHELHEDTKFNNLKATGPLKTQAVQDESFIDKIDRDALPSESWIKYVSSNDSKIVRLFHGQLKVVTECASKECDHDAKTTYQFFDHLELPIPGGDNDQPCDLKDCLNLKMKKKPCSDKYCHKCGQKNFKRNEEISKSPRYLILSLKRFFLSPRRHKYLRHIRFPVKSLDLSDYTKNDSQHHQYMLYATINHSGSDCGDHYTAYVRCKNCQWYKLAESEIKGVPHLCKYDTILDEWQKSSVCVLFYKRKRQQVCAKPTEAIQTSPHPSQPEEWQTFEIVDESEKMDTDQYIGEEEDLQILGESDSMETDHQQTYIV